jgi:hypothetical protein
MKLSALTAALGLSSMLLALLSVPVANGHDPSVQLRVSVFNSVPVSRYIVEGAEHQAAGILRDAQIEVTWLNCFQDAKQTASNELCSEALYPSHLQLRIVRVSRGLRPSTVGISFSGSDGKGCYADLFYEPIERLEEETHASPTIVLGHAMAHELGHLLLGTNSHSPNGLMRAQWTPEDLANASRGKLRFSREQALRILDRIAESRPESPTRLQANDAPSLSQLRE